MSTHRGVALGIAFFMLLSVSAAPSWANSAPPRRASNYGPGPDSNPTNTFGNCKTSTSNCEAFNLTPMVVTFDGKTFDVVQFVFVSNAPAVVLDVVDLGAVPNSTTFDLPSLFTPSLTEVFACDNGTNAFAQDSMGMPVNGPNAEGPCTPLTIPNGSPSGVTANANGSFTTDMAFADLVMDIPASSSVPEPSSLVLLSVGLIALVGACRRIQQPR